MKALLLLLALVALAACQPDFEGRRTVRGSLSPASSGTVFDNAEADTEVSFVVGCDVNVHALSGVSSNTNTQASTITLVLDNTVPDADDQDLFVVLIAPDGRRVFPTTNRDPLPSEGDTATLESGGYTCQSNEFCVVDYHCAPFAGGSYSIEISQADPPSAVNNYTITAYEWSESADSISVNSDRFQFDENQAESRVHVTNTDLEVDSIPGPRTFRHYYVDFNRDLPRLGLHTLLKIRVVDWFDDNNLNITDGDVALCYNTNYFVGATPTTTNLDGTEIPCGDVCADFDLGNDVVEIEFASGCSIPADELWLGIRTPQDGTPARYTIEFITRAKTIYPVTTITEPSFKLDNYLDEWDSDFCAPSEGGFTCEAYYETSLASVGLGANSFSNGHGPWFIVHVHGVSNGDLYFNVHDSDFGGPKSRCSEPQWYCGGDGGEINVNDGDNDGNSIPDDAPIQEGQECYVWIPPCYWTDDGTVDGELDFNARNWVTTVVGLNVDPDEDRLFYGLDFDVVAMPLTSVQLAERMGPIFGQIRTGYYNHYSVAIPQDAIVPASKFVVEMYSRHEDHDLALFWNYNTEAGFTEDCLSYRGRCDTLGDEENSSPGYDDNHNYCRFAFFVCDNPSESFTLSNPRQVNDSLWWEVSDSSRNDLSGIRVDNLLAGTYYFSVHALRNPEDYDSYDYESKYTLQMSFTEGVELWENEPVLDHVYLNEYSTHYYFDMPSAEDDPLAQGIEIYVADVQNFASEFDVSAHWNCDALAGNCPCFTSEATALFDPEGDHHEIFYIPRCSCPGRVWVSVENRARWGAFNFTAGALKPVGFTVTARVVRSVQEDAASGSLFDPENGFVTEFPVPRDQWGKVSAVIAPRFDEAACRSCLNYRFYRFEFNSLQPGDALVTRLEFVPEIEDATPEAWLFVISNVDRTLAIDPGCSARNVLDGRIQACRARANLDEGWNGLPGEEWSFCQLVFEPCTADASAEACYDDQQELDNSAIQARRFDQDREWYAAVQSVDDESAIVFTLQAQVRSQAATSLVDGVAIQALVFEGTYNHYSFSVSGSANAQSLVFEFYSIIDQDAEIRFYINAGTFAGLERDCLSSIHQSTLGLCNECVLFGSGNDDEDAVSCSYQVRPCDIEDTTYFVSAYQWWDPTEPHTHAFFDDRFYYTISAHIQEPIELLETGHPFTGQLWEWDDDDATVHSTAYYTVTVPSNLQASRLRLTVAAVVADAIYVTVGGRSPVDFCRCPRTGLELIGGGSGSSLEWTRDFCDLTPNDVYWVVVDGINDNSEPATFTIHAERIPYNLVEVTLISRSDNNDPVFLSPVVSYYDSERRAINTPAISPSVVNNGWERYDSYFWDVTAAVGRSMNIRFRQNHNNDTQTLDYYLATGAPVSTPSANGGFGETLGPLPEDTCDNLYTSGSGEFNSDGAAARIHISPCELQSTTYFLTFSGESLEVNSVVPYIDLKIVLVDALTIIEVPTSSDPIAVTGDEGEFDGLFASVDYDNELENNLENGLYFRTEGSISLDAGERLLFTKNGGGGSMEVSFENLPCDGVLCDDTDCEFFACEDMSGEWWIRLTGVSDSIQDITIELIPSDTVDSGLSVTSISSIELGDRPPVFDALGDNEWQWFRISSDADFDNDLVRRFATNISVANFFYTASVPVFAPALEDEGDNDWIAIYADTAALGIGATGPPTCGGTSYDPEPDVNDVCCVGDIDILFAVARADEDFNIEFIEQALNSGAPSSPGSSLTSTQSVGIGELDEPGSRRTVRWFQFTVNEGTQGFWYFFNTTDAEADGENFELYANIGSLAGSDNSASCPSFSDDMVESDQDPAVCHQEIGTASLDISCTQSFGDDACVGFVPICDGCNTAGARVYLAVTSQFEGEAEFNLAIEQVSDLGELSVSVGSSDSVNVGEFPSDSQLEWEQLSFDSNGNDAFRSCNAVYDHYTVDVSALVSDLMDDSSFFPDFDDLDDLDRYQFVLRLTNIEEVGAADGELTQGRVESEVRWYISDEGGLAGECDCHTGGEWDSGSLCDETNVNELEEDTTWEYECIIYAENLVSGCAANGGATWAMSVGRGEDNNGDLPQFSYTLTAGFFVNATATNEYNIHSISTSSSIAAGAVPNSFTSIDSTNDFGDATEENTDTWLKVDVSSLGPTDYLRVWFEFTEDGLNLDTSLMEPNSLGDFSPITVEPFVGGYYTDADPLDLLWRDDFASTNSYDDEARNDCGTIDLDDNGEYICSVQFAPRDLSIFYGPDGRNELWLRVQINNQPDRDYSFGVYAERKTIDVVQEDLVPVDGYVKINDTLFDIFDRQWRFHQFTVPENNGLYHDLFLSVYDEECGDVSLEVFSTFSGNVDVMRPARVPTPAQHAASGSSFSIAPNCQIHGGNYWLGVWAPEDFQTFPDPIDVPGNNPDFEVRPGTYRVYAELFEWPQKVLDPECWYTETAENFIPRIVMPVEAENRGSELVIEFSYRTTSGVLSDGDWGLHVSHNNMPHSSLGNGECGWDLAIQDEPYTDTAYDYGCESGGTSCWVVIPACEFEQGYYYIWLAGLSNFADADRLTVRSYFDRKHIPVATLNEANGYTATWTGQLIEHQYTSASYQYYKVVVDSDANREGHFDVRLNVEDCNFSDCSLDMYVTRGPVGHANDFDSFQEFSSGNCLIDDGDITGEWDSLDTCNCHDYYAGSSERLWGDLIIDSLCYAEDNQYFIGVRQTTDDLCVFSVTVSVREKVEPIVPSEIVCAEVNCVDYYRVDLSGVPDQRLITSITADLVATDGDELRLLLKEGRIPYWVGVDSFTPDFDDSNSETSGCFDDSDFGLSPSVTWAPGCGDIGDFYLAVQNPDANLYSCDACDSAVPYQLEVTITTLDFSNGTFLNIPAAATLVGSPFDLYDGRASCPASCGVYADTTILANGITPDNINDDLILETIGSAPGVLNDGQVLRVNDWFGEPLRRFYTPLASSTAFTIYVDNVESACGFTVEDMEYAVGVGGAFDSVPCTCSGDGSFTATCSGGASAEYTCFEGDVQHVVTIDTCSDPLCPVSFDLWVEASGSDRSELGTAHNDAAGWVDVVRDRDCGGSDLGYYVDVALGQPLSVQIREPFGGDEVSITVDLYRQDCTFATDCSITDGTSQGTESDCRVDALSEGAYSMYGCAEPGRYYVDVSASNLDSDYNYWSVELSAWNQWVSLSNGGAASDVMFGADRHFYSFANNGGAKIVLDITNGPSISFRVTDNFCEGSHFNHHQTCSFGRCLVDISTEALNSNAPTFYIVLTSDDVASGRHANSLATKATNYELSVQTGSSACASRPSSGFCGGSATDVDAAFTSAAWTGPSAGSSTWDYENPTVRDNMARWKYASFVEGLCPSPPDECKRWLRRIACADAFPTCDASGFLLGTCRAACYEVECECGKWLEADPRPEFACLSGRYQEEQTGTCFTIPDRTPPPPPPPVNVTINFMDTCDVHVATLDAGLIDLQRATACSATDVEALLLIEAGGLARAGQIRTNEILGNEISVTIFGSNVESAVSICTRVVNRVTIERDGSLDGTCLQDAVLQIEENTDLLELDDTTPYVAPTSVVDPPPAFTIPGITIPDNTIPTIPSQITIPDLQSESGAFAVLPAALTLVLACVVALFA